MSSKPKRRTQASRKQITKNRPQTAYKQLDAQLTAIFHNLQRYKPTMRSPRPELRYMWSCPASPFRSEAGERWNTLWDGLMLKQGYHDGRPSAVMRALTARFHIDRRSTTPDNNWLTARLLTKRALSGDHSAIKDLAELGRREKDELRKMAMEHAVRGGTESMGRFRYTRFYTSSKATVDVRVVDGTEITFKGVDGVFVVQSTPVRESGGVKAALQRFNTLQCTIRGTRGTAQYDQICTSLKQKAKRRRGMEL